ncbi:PQQ-binding-like beta-propeller repeat protein [Belliella sp. DSM 111904]|uniref:PQQ-binding-like beta-propeller repeat protein n=1 Tax=Belliella filtrata TaxID=2923435 RepID=A0ABS9V4I7_9BACT|nr:PQQ-binding-like beta-propeller repeat protein [Belliella filtrata]MCH7411322.1 PQQ-binding-like beta-propeller repeat protein [Belliella filtrata]
MKKLNQLFALFLLLISIPSYSQRRVWEQGTGAAIHASPLIDNEYLFVGNAQGIFFKLDQNTGEVIWKYNSKAPIFADAAVWNDLVLFSNEKGNLFALKKDSGKLEWVVSGNPTQAIDLWDYYRAGPVAGKDKVYWGTEDGGLVALEPNTGKIIWNFPTNGAIHMSPVLEGNMVVVGNFKGKVFAVDADNGKQIWSFQANGSEYFPNAEFHKSPTVIDGKVYLGSRDTQLYVLDIESGKKNYEYTEAGGSWIIASPLVFQEKMFFGSSDTYKFYALDRNTGEEIWSIRTYTRSYATPLPYQNTVLMAGFDGKIRAYELSTGEQIWEFQTSTSKDNFSKLYTPEGKFRNDLTIHSAEEGEKLLNNLGPIVSTPVLNQNLLFFTSLDGKVYAIKLP